MAKTFDMSKFRKGITKSISGISAGFKDPSVWISTGSYALNYLLTEDFYKGVALGKVTMFSGMSGSGKSFIASGNIVRNAQEQGIYVVLLDTENALDEVWLQKLGVDTSIEKMEKFNVSLICDAAKIIHDFVSFYKELDECDRPEVLFVIDSLGMMQSNIQKAQETNLKGDFGSKPKELMALVRSCLNMFGDLNIGLVATNHSYESQDPYNPDPKISGGSAAVYAASAVIAMKQLKLKVDEDGNKTNTVNGIRAGCKVMKSRYSKPFEDIELQIPWTNGMSVYTGLFDLFEKKGIIKKEGMKYVYIDLNGEIHKYWSKEYLRNENGIYDLIMTEFKEKEKLIDSADAVIETADGELED